MELNSPDASLELNRAPFIRLLFALIAGILSSRIVLFSNIVLSCLPLLLLTGSLAAFVFRKLFLTIRGHYLFGVYILILLFITGDALSLLQDEKSQSIELYHSLGNRNVFYSLHLISSCVEKEKTCKAIAELDFCGQPGNWHRIRGKVLMHLRKSKAALSLKYGDRLLLEGRIQELNAPPNPGMFDYRHYLADRNIFLQVWCDSSSWKQEPGNGVAWLLHICSAGRDQMLALLRKHHIDGDELGVGAALLLGYEDKLSPDILQAYSSSGVMHVLSVSGLHVAILFAVLNACLGFTRRVSYGPFLKALILLLFLCLYATLTGLSPAVLRSSGMFCFVILGEASRRTSSIFNTLSASAFLLLLINPMLLYDAGFQLSYLAVLGIVVLQPSLQKIWEAPFWLARQIYTMICVSVAAQLFTLPLSLYYFHQFPNYFLITNLVVIPLSTFVIYAGIGFFLLQALPVIGPFSAKVFVFLLKALNASVLFFGELPGAALKGVWLNMTETLLLCLVIFLAVRFCIGQKPRWLFLCLYTGVLFTSQECLNAWKQGHQNIMLVYDVPHSSVIDFIQGRTVYSVLDSSCASNPALLRYLVQPCRDEKGIDHERRRLMIPGLVSYFCLNKHCLVLRGRVEYIPKLPEADFLVVSKGAFCKSIESGALRFSQLIVDASCSQKETTYWKGMAALHHLTLWVIAEQGAFVEVI